MQAALPARADQPARPVPERAGEPSVFHHVIYIIKENRSYDQVLGDIREGNGDANLCVFGENVTPNQHQLVRDFVLLDNTYCCSILSADGHQWTDTGIAMDYVEREFAGWPRSYPAGGSGEAGSDALAYSPAGFIWNDALAHGKTVCDFGEFTTARKQWKDSTRKGEPNFLDCYRDFLGSSNVIAYSCEPDIEALRPYIVTNTIGWDLDVPDVWRAAQFIKDLKQFEAADNLPNLVILWLPNDHTSGTAFGSPTPAAQVADNDLAVGQVVEAVSHSRYWKDTCIFAVEDDPQNGWDHVSGYRTTAYVASAYTTSRRRGQHAIQPDQFVAHDGTHARFAADEPDGRHGHADVRLLHQHGGFHAVYCRGQPDAARPNESSTQENFRLATAQRRLRFRASAAQEGRSVSGRRVQSHFVGRHQRTADAVSGLGGEMWWMMIEHMFLTRISRLDAKPKSRVIHQKL